MRTERRLADYNGEVSDAALYAVAGVGAVYWYTRWQARNRTRYWPRRWLFQRRQLRKALGRLREEQKK